MEINKILIIIRRSNGDVFLSTPLIEALINEYPNVTIDLLVNKSTEAIAKILPFINTIHIYDYEWKKEGILKRLKNELKLISSIYKKYDLAISLTASDHSVLYAYLAGHKSISAVDLEHSKSWWKQYLLTSHYKIYTNKHMIHSTLMPLNLLGIKIDHICYKPKIKYSLEDIKNKFSFNKKLIAIYGPNSIIQ